MNRRLIIIDKDTGKEVERLDFTGGYNIAVANLHDSGEIKFIRTLDNGKYDERHWIKNYLYRPIAEKLVAKFPEISHIKPSKILFIEDTEWERGIAKQPWIGQIKKSNKQLESMTGYEYVMEIRSYFTDKMSKAQIIALIYHEIRHIHQDGSVLKHDIEDWSNMVTTLGKDWATTDHVIENILDDDFEGWDDLRKAGKQISMFEGLKVAR